MDDMDRHAFINTQRWTCEITEEQKTKLVPNDDLVSIFDGQCCFQSNFLNDDEGRLFLHFEVNEQYTDFVQLVTTFKT
jgi:chloramphenicol O-acetyltransferase